MLSKQDIINLALVKVGNQPRTEVTDSYLTLAYNAGKTYLLGKHYWRFAKTIIGLSLNATTTVKGWNYVYRLPNNVGCIFDVIPHNAYDIFGTNLVCNANPLSLECSIVDIDDSFPTDFGLLLASWMAKEIATVVKNGIDSGLSNLLTSQYQEMLLDAISTDSANIPSLTFRSNRYIDVR
jgi:hypothetical protein